MIQITKSPTADTRTCDYTKVDRPTLLASSKKHIDDVAKGMKFFKDLMTVAAARHDHDKLSGIDAFHTDFAIGFQQTEWWDNHRKINRHHLAMADGVPSDVNLIDVLEYITDSVMAGLARSGKVYPLELSDGLLLQRAFNNTVRLLKSNVVVVTDASHKPKYRMLVEGDIIAGTDEYLTDDCVTWGSVEDLNGMSPGTWILGGAYRLNTCEPMRRLVDADSTLLRDDIDEAAYAEQVLKDTVREDDAASVSGQPIEVAQAIQVLKNAMAEEDPADKLSYAHEWHRDLAAVIHNSIIDYQGESRCAREIADDAATRCMKLCFIERN